MSGSTCSPMQTTHTSTQKSGSRRNPPLKMFVGLKTYHVTHIAGEKEKKERGGVCKAWQCGVHKRLIRNLLWHCLVKSIPLAPHVGISLAYTSSAFSTSSQICPQRQKLHSVSTTIITRLVFSTSVVMGPVQSGH